MSAQREKCYLCGDCGEIEAIDQDNKRQTVPCPECISAEIAEDREQATTDLEKAKSDAWRDGAKFALLAISRVADMCFLTDSMKEVAIKLATEEVIKERERMQPSTAEKSGE